MGCVNRDTTDFSRVEFQLQPADIHRQASTPSFNDNLPASANRDTPNAVKLNDHATEVGGVYTYEQY
jgi:hypothetical protein